jgi:DNA repair protein RadC
MSEEAKHCIREVGLRTVKEYATMNNRVMSPADAYQVWEYVVERSGWWDPQRETVCTLFTDYQGHVDGFHLVALGDKSSASPDVGLMLRPVILAGSARVFLFHNHPGGGLEPSGADIEITRRVALACDLFDLRLIDHLIIATREETNWRWVSLRDEYPDVFEVKPEAFSNV